MSTIELERVGKRYGPVIAVDEVSLRVAEGELVTILGPSGSGKTTLLTLIAGLTEPTSGHIRIGGRDVTFLPAARRNVGLVFQSYALFPHMSVFDNVAFPLSVRSVSREDMAGRVAEALRLVRLSGFERRRPSQLSGGQQQRVALARAFVFEPDILLLDDGCVQQIGTPEEVYLRPANRFVADFLGMANLFEGVVHKDGEGCRIRLENGAAITCPDPGVAPGSEVAAIVRPERIAIGSGESGDGLPARVSDVIYLGPSVRYHLASEHEREVVAVAADRGVRFRPGSDVRLTWAPEDVWVIPEVLGPQPASIGR